MRAMRNLHFRKIIERRSLADLHELKESLPFPLPGKYESEIEIRARIKSEMETLKQECLRKLKEFIMELNKKEYKKYAWTGCKVGRFRPPKDDGSRRMTFNRSSRALVNFRRLAGNLNMFTVSTKS